MNKPNGKYSAVSYVKWRSTKRLTESDYSIAPNIPSATGPSLDISIRTWGSLIFCNSYLWHLCFCSMIVLFLTQATGVIPFPVMAQDPFVCCVVIRIIGDYPDSTFWSFDIIYYLIWDLWGIVPNKFSFIYWSTKLLLNLPLHPRGVKLVDD